MLALLTFWKKLLQISQVTFTASSKSKEENGWNGKGEGSVTVNQTHENIVVFSEKGCWNGCNGAYLTFTNVFRWTLDIKSGIIALEHLRRGTHDPVFLFHLAPTGINTLSSVGSHFCNHDAYFGQVSLDHHLFRFNWRIIGPKKNEELEYVYS